jgi:hypothetical protein
MNEGKQKKAMVSENEKKTRMRECTKQWRGYMKRRRG